MLHEAKDKRLKFSRLFFIFLVVSHDIPIYYCPVNIVQDESSRDICFAKASPMPITVEGVAFSDILTCVLTRGDAGSLAPLDCQHYHGHYSEARPLGESGPKGSPKTS